MNISSTLTQAHESSLPRENVMNEHHVPAYCLHLAFQALQKWQDILGDASRVQPQMLRHTPPRDLSPPAHDLPWNQSTVDAEKNSLTQSCKHESWIA
jgi:hypothetical protein